MLVRKSGLAPKFFESAMWPGIPLHGAAIGGMMGVSRKYAVHYGPQSRFLSLNRPGRRAGCRYFAASSHKKRRHPASSDQPALQPDGPSMQSLRGVDCVGGLPGAGWEDS